MTESRPLTTHWARALRELIFAGKPVVMITVVKVEGSAPRKSACRMFVLADAIMATIGGGNLEFEAITLARKMLDGEIDGTYRLELYGLGPALKQCCGGAVTLAFETITTEPGWLAGCEVRLDDFNAVLVSRFSESGVRRQIFDVTDIPPPAEDAVVLVERLGELRPVVVVFGAGHVGNALVEVLSRLPFVINWVDERADVFPDTLPAGVKAFTSRSSLEYIAQLPDNAMVVVLTHSHALDEDICFRYLNGKEFYFLGLIGSKTKRARFLHRLRDRGIGQPQLARLVCPIGVPEVTGSSPPEIAISVAAQLLNLRDHIKVDTSLS